MLGVLQAIGAGTLLVMAMSLLPVAGSSYMRWASRPRAWQEAAAVAANYTADLVTAASIGTGLAAALAAALVAWWAS